MDNAPHTYGQKIKAVLGFTGRKGDVVLLFASLQSRVESPHRDWRNIKYEWLLFEAYSASELEQAIEEIGDRFSSEIHVNFFLSTYRESALGFKPIKPKTKKPYLYL